MSQILYTDFEFNQITEPKLNMVSSVTYDPVSKKVFKWWLHNDPAEVKKLCAYIKKFNTVVGFSCVAEARSFLSMNLLPLSFEWIDLFFEYRCLTNHNDALQWGDQLVDGKVRKVHKPRPKWQREEGEVAKSFRATHSLAEATYKLTGKIRDTEHKTKMRNLIISNPKSFSKEEREAILNYNAEDVLVLEEMYNKTIELFLTMDKALTREEYLTEAKSRGRYAALTAIMEQKGYPIDVEKTRNFSKQVGSIIYDCQRDINNLFPDIVPFKWNKKEGRFSWDQSRTREWIKTLDEKIVSNWILTDGGKKKIKELSLSLEAWQKFFDYKHDYPTDNFGAQIVRYLKLKQTLFGFVPTTNKDKKTFWDSVGSDGRVRPYLNPFGSQSSRSQPGSTGFMFLKPAWMRALVVPAKGYAMAGVDYGSQEFFISALLSGDQGMIDSYLSGDVYLAFAKLAGMVPPDGTKDKYKKERDLCKATVLGISYLMSKYGLAIKLTNDTGEEWSEDEAQDMIDIFYDAYPILKDFQDWIVEVYQDQGCWKLPCGWYLWGDNENFRSVSNCPVQGFGASVMRKAVDLATQRGLYVPFTLHDAVYIEYKVGEEHKIKILHDCMREAFRYYVEENYPEDRQKFGDIADKIKLDPFAWSLDYEKDSEIVVEDLTIPASNIYIDERSINDYLLFSKYFEDNVGDIL